MLTLDRAALYRALEDVDFYSYGTLTGQELLAVAGVCGLSDENRARYRIEEAKGAVVVALRYGDGLYVPPPWTAAYGGGDAAAGKVAIARFARANWYAEIRERLKILSQRLRFSLEAQAAAVGEPVPPMRLWQRVTNSGLPEKPFAFAAGLGSQGRNQLLIARRSSPQDGMSPPYSSAVLLGLLLCPVPIGPAPDGAGQGAAKALTERGTYPLCGSCRKCIDACPSGALSVGRWEALSGAPAAGTGPTKARAAGVAASIVRGSPGDENSGLVSFSRTTCIQHWTARVGEMPREVAAALPNRLYGCDSCLNACPYFLTDPVAHTEFGLLGPELPAEFFLRAPTEEIKKNLRGSALDMAWMSVEAFRRNALFASCTRDGTPMIGSADFV